MATATKEKVTTKGKISQIVGVVVDVDFPADKLPAIYNAIKVKLNGKDLLLEVAQHLSESSVRAISLGTTDGLKRGDEAVDTGAPISVPIGKETTGRMFNVTGEPIDGKGSDFKNFAPIHKAPPTLAEQSSKIEILETGIKVIDLIAPITKGGKVGLFGGAGLRVGLSGLTIAEGFRDEGKDVLLFIDNIFRFTQAGAEVSALLGRLPSAVGYQPNLA